MTQRDATRRQAREINERIDEIDGRYEPGTVRIMSDGSVTVMSDPMPNTNEQGRVFAGWDTEVMRQLGVK